MRKIEMLQICMVLLFILGYSVASAQDYVVSIKGDTVRGKVKYFNGSGVRYTGGSSKYIQLTSPDGKKSMFQVLQAIAFRIDDESYHTLKFQDSYTFMKLISQGYLSLYAYQLENQTTWDGRYFVKKDGSLLDVPNLGFKKRVSQYLADCPDAVTKVQSGELSKTNLVKLVDTYNACVELKNHPKPVQKSSAQEAWINLETAVKALPEFDKKSDAIEMIRDIEKKVGKHETVPSFLVNGVKDALKDQANVKESLDTALVTLTK